MKSVEKNQAKKLRKKGLSLKEISEKLKVSKSVVSFWVKDIQLSKDQKNRLKIKSIKFGNTFSRDKFKKIRIEYQEEGEKKAKEKNWLHISGCMLYWAEGAKKKNSVIFVNSDIDMVKLFVNFLKTFFKLDNSKFIIQIYCYDGNGISIKNIEKYWVYNLNLLGCTLKKSYVKHAPNIYAKRGKLDYGTCRLIVYSTKIVQHIYGALQQYAGFTKQNWLMAPT
jgi:transcriptional regulator with XRE-family HTH domain